MHDYTIKNALRTNISSLKGRVFYDVNYILNQLKYMENRQIPIKDSEYELFLYVTQLSEHSSTLVFNVELYNKEYDEVPLSEMFSLFDSRSEARAWLGSTIDKFIDSLNQKSIKITYFEDFDGAYDVHNGKLYAAVYDFSRNIVCQKPEPKTLDLVFEGIEVDKVLDKIKEN